MNTRLRLLTPIKLRGVCEYLSLKTCNTCNTAKSIFEFYVDVRLADGRNSTCKPCVRFRNKRSLDRRRAAFNAQRRAYQKANLPKFREANRRYRAKHRDKVNLRKTLWRYGITLEQYITRYLAQERRCAICCAYTALLVDHDHKTKKNRGLLCDPCNKAIGFLRDRPELARAAALYLEKGPTIW